ncbi:hypothetical protein AB0H00_26910 [Nocardia sp. NPDC023852]|uniref:hypothetical protein n=1 Tax=Nocardia sp. NPDC023852 TaxID=3154697 RepID=UPI0033FA6B95
MSIEFGRPATGRRGAVAQVRGGSAGAISGVISLAAHGWAAGGMPPTATVLVLLAAASTVIGATVAGIALLRDTSTGLVAALVTAQVLGHLTMGFSSGHLHHGDAQLTPVMLTAHLSAAVAAAIVVRGAEAAYRVGTAVLARVIPVCRRAPVAGPALLRTDHRDRVILRVLAAQALCTRGPPLPVSI